MGLIVATILGTARAGNVELMHYAPNRQASNLISTLSEIALANSIH